MHHLNLRSKLFNLSALPMIIILILSTMVLVEVFQKKQNLQMTKNHINKAITISKIVHLLQLERGLSIDLVANKNSSKKSIYDSTKKELGMLLETNTIQNNTTLLSELAKERNSIDINSLTIDEIEKFYSLKISILLDIINTIPNSISNHEDRNYIQAYTHLVVMKESLGKTRAILNKSLCSMEYESDDFIRLNSFFK